MRGHAVFERREEILVDVGGLLVARGLERRLVLEPAALVDRVVELTERVGVLPPEDEELEPLGVFGVLRLALGKRGRCPPDGR